MKTLILSDTHLSARDPKKKLDFLYDLITSYDHVILNGDFWEGYIETADKFADSKFKVLFPELLKRNTVYIPGNHDVVDQAMRIAPLFSKITVSVWEIEVNKKKFVIQHGHLLAPSMELRTSILRKRILFEGMHLVKLVGIPLFGKYFYYYSMRRLQ